MIIMMDVDCGLLSPPALRDDGCRFQAKVTVKLWEQVKGKHPWAMKEKLLYIHRLNPHSTVINNKTKLIPSKNAGCIALLQVMESVSNLL